MTCCCRHQIEKDDADIRRVIDEVQKIRMRPLILPWADEVINLLRDKNIHRADESSGNVVSFIGVGVDQGHDFSPIALQVYDTTYYLQLDEARVIGKAILAAIGE